MDEDRDEPQFAPWYRIPSRRIVAVEHPGIILDPSKPDYKAQLSLRPEDPLAGTVESMNRQTNNILLKVTVPKWTGRKRKRGSDEPFTMSSDSTQQDIERERQSCAFRQRSLMDNVHQYSVEVMGTVERTHNFRSIPDYVYSTMASPFTRNFREKILPFEFEKMRQFDISMSKGETKNVDLVPPPAFSKTYIPFQYTYRQNPTVKLSQDTSGNITAFNTQTATKVLTHLVTYDVAEVPSKPRDECPPISTLDPDLQKIIATLQRLFSERIAWTRRALMSEVRSSDRYILKHAIGYVGYIFRSGPWRDAIFKFGHDPRKDVEFRKYQTFVFRILPREPDVARDGGGSARQRINNSNISNLNVATSSGREFSGRDISSIPTVTREGGRTGHIWTGKAPLAVDGKIWMVCDIVDPIVKNLLFPAQPNKDFLRKECDPICDGWYGNGTLAKVKTIMRQKIHALTQQHREPADAEYECILGFPDHASDEKSLEAFHVDAETATPRESMLATEVRATIKGAANWRWAVSAKAATSSSSSSQQQRQQQPEVEEEEEREATRRVIEDEEEANEEDENELDDDNVGNEGHDGV
ncbi:hypothetical protein UA08_00544 [Talaromyces atroroseus]|uniref:Transcription factor IIIC subunit 5 HTH domain-containing protein n=1 Tax=Talaromyces atroroseus TaxID=1441469 RepID=A0A225BBK8_TALAT|nr:hypothetical protein UA08_00544 [Talaromyces atroroseus]OKL64285.1 hypothetical protein UA08_00544 [Talaromyces atroroseus]